MRTQNRWQPRNEDAGAEGTRLAQSAQEQIERVGMRLNVTTPARPGIPAIVRQIAFVPQPISATLLTRLEFENIVNIAYNMTMDFVCAGDTTILPGDLIGPYEGATWQTAGTQPETYAGVSLLRHVIAQRE